MKNGKSENTQNAVIEPVGNGAPVHGRNISEDYKTFDISKAVRQDVQAAVSLLSLILDNPQILDLVVFEIEKIRTRIIEQESLPKKEDFHPELKPNA